nr:hypothetical protein [Tanacetum cinerariifolium]
MCEEVERMYRNENESDDVNHASINEDNHHGNTARVDEHLDDDNAPLNNATSIGEDNHNKSDTQDSKYDADSSKNEKAKDDVDVMIDKENEIHEVEVRNGYEIDIDDFYANSGGEGDYPSGRITSTTIVSFEKCMNELKRINVKAHAWLSKIPVEHWSRAHLSRMVKSSQANEIGTQTSVACSGNRVNSVQGGATNHAYTDVGVRPS